MNLIPHNGYPCSVIEAPPDDIHLENIIEEMLMPYKLRNQNYISQLILYGMIIEEDCYQNYLNHEPTPKIPPST